jgi:hypothetical protein
MTLISSRHLHFPVMLEHPVRPCPPIEMCVTFSGDKESFKVVVDVMNADVFPERRSQLKGDLGFKVYLGQLEIFKNSTHSNFFEASMRWDHFEKIKYAIFRSWADRHLPITGTISLTSYVS